MKYILLILIKIYWKYVPESKRRRCLFKTSCSNYVYKKAKEKGLFAGLKALLFRIHNCNSNYDIIEIDNRKLLVSSEYEVFNESEINHSILNS